MTAPDAGAWAPGREIELLAGTPAGGGQDRPARALVQALQGPGGPGVPIRLTNLPGRGGANAWESLAATPGDGCRVAISSPTLLTNRLLGVSAHDHDALTPLATLYTEHIAFVTLPGSALRSGADLVARLARDAGSVTIALATAFGNTNHIAVAQVAAHAGGRARDLRVNVFDSALHAVAEVLAGRADIGAVTAVSAAPEIADRRLHGIAVSAPQRLGGVYAGVPTWVEQDVPCTVGTWRGVVGPGGLSPAQIAWWQRALGAAVTDTAWREQLAAQFWSDAWLDAAATRAFLDAERTLLGTALAQIGLLG